MARTHCTSVNNSDELGITVQLVETCSSLLLIPLFRIFSGIWFIPVYRSSGILFIYWYTVHTVYRSYQYTVYTSIPYIPVYRIYQYTVHTVYRSYRIPFIPYTVHTGIPFIPVYRIYQYTVHTLYRSYRYTVYIPVYRLCR